MHMIKPVPSECNCLMYMLRCCQTHSPLALLRQSGSTPLHSTIYCFYTESAMRALLEAGADANAKNDVSLYWFALVLTLLSPLL